MPISKRSSQKTRRLVDTVFGEEDDPMTLLDQRSQIILRPYRSLVWEGDASTFEFRYVSPAAEEILGYPSKRWTEEPTFWSDVVVYPDDRDHAISYCALASGQGKDHDFIYRARHAEGHTVWLHDFVRVVRGRYGLPAYLRGVMIDVSNDQFEIGDGLFYANPTFDALRAEAGLV